MSFDSYLYIKKCTVAGRVPDSVSVSAVDCTTLLDMRKAENFSDISGYLSDINNCVVTFCGGGSFRIIQAGGFSHDRGLFCDLY